VHHENQSTVAGVCTQECHENESILVGVGGQKTGNNNGTN